MYTVNAANATIRVRCDAPWTVFQRRFNGSVSFKRNWLEYENGFGDVGSEFWLGNKNLHLLTARGSHSFQFVFRYNTEPSIINSTYGSFSVSDGSDAYRLHIDQFQGGNGGNAFMDSNPSLCHNGQRFSTTDRDNDESIRRCATEYESGFWFDNCWYINPNGLYRPTIACDEKIGINCIRDDHRGTDPVQSTELRIRPN